MHVLRKVIFSVPFLATLAIVDVFLGHKLHPARQLLYAAVILIAVTRGHYRLRPESEKAEVALTWIVVLNLFVLLGIAFGWYVLGDPVFPSSSLQVGLLIAGIVSVAIILAAIKHWFDHRGLVLRSE